MKLIFALTLLFFLPFSYYTQKNISYGKGSLYFSVGLPKAWYGKSNVQYKSDVDEFTLKYVRSKDKAFDFSNNLSLLQFNVSLGMFVKNHWAINLSFEHLNYINNVNQNLNINGNSFLGIHKSEAIDLDSIGYFNQKLNALNLGVMRAGRLMAFDRRKKYTLTSNFGLNAGVLLSSSTNTYKLTQHEVTMHLSGVNGNVSAGVKFELNGRAFIGVYANGGAQYQFKLKTEVENGKIKQFYPIATVGMHVGFYLYAKFKDDCNTCPQW